MRIGSEIRRCTALSNDELWDETRALARGERSQLARLLIHLAEVKRRDVRLERAYPGLYHYLPRLLLRKACRRSTRELQTLVAGLLVAPAERSVYAEALAAAGVTRLPELGRMLESETGEPHDGRYPLGELVRWVSGPPEAVAANEQKALASVLAEVS